MPRREPKTSATDADVTTSSTESRQEGPPASSGTSESRQEGPPASSGTSRIEARASDRRSGGAIEPQSFADSTPATPTPRAAENRGLEDRVGSDGVPSLPEPPRLDADVAAVDSERIDSERTVAQVSEVYVVGVGASAGGLDALEQFFSAMPEDSGMVFVVIQHLSPDFKSVMDELLSRRTRIPVLLVEDGMVVEPNHIYLIPPKKEMIISGGKLLLSDKGGSQELTLPIDIFFRSLAQELGERAIGIVLSGAGSDGARGIRDIHDAGGLILCQDEATAYFDGMPRSARETGVVDLVLPPADMPQALVAHVTAPLQRHLAGSLGDPNERPYGVSSVLRLLQTNYGIDFSHYKPSTVVRRIERRLQMSQSPTLDGYVDRLASDTQELDDLFHDLLIGVTRFFRDEDAFDILETKVIPDLVGRVKPAEELRVWVAGCATGEEAYSIAILLLEHLRARGERCRIKILATDLHRGSLDFASRGLYTEDRVARVRPKLLERYFDKRGATYQVSPELRQCVVFAPHNVIKDAPFTRIDLVSCRNLLIYLQPLAQKKVLSLLHFSLKRQGILMLGPSEHAGQLVDDFETVDAHWRIYRKQRDVRFIGDTRFSSSRGGAGVHTEQRAGSGLGYSLSQVIGVYDALLDEHMPPSLLVNERRELVHAFSGANRYLKVKEGRPTTDLFDMIDADLKGVVTGAMQRALKERLPVAYNGLSLKVGDEERQHRLVVRPVIAAGARIEHVLITIEPIDVEDSPPQSQSELNASDISRDQLGSLEEELRRTKESLQATIEELETTNEELQATNEELLAANEELQSTNEELQSVNEELYTVNAEYQKKITELTELTNDMDNLLASIQVGTVFLDQNQCIRKFTPLIAEVFNLLPQDVGRPLVGFSNNLNVTHLLEDLRQVQASERAIEREVCDRSGNWFFLRILPYRMRGAVNGVVLTLIDINALKAAENAVFRERYLLDGLMNSVPDAIYFKDSAGRFVRINPAMARWLGLDDSGAAVGRYTADFLPDSQARVLDARDAGALRGVVQPYQEEQYQLPGGKPSWFMSTRQPLEDAEGNIVGMLGVARDISEQKRAEDQIRLAVKRRDEFLAMLSHELRNPLSAIVNAGVLLHSENSSADTRGKSLEVIERQSRQMRRLLDDLLEVSRITQNKIELRKQVVDARSVVQEALVAVRDKFAARGIELRVTVGDESVVVEADPARLQQVIVNLLDNAVKYTAARFGGDCTDGAPSTKERPFAAESSGTTSLELRKEDGHAVFRISDNGLGIDPTIIGSVFEPFVQGTTTIHRTEGGMGVGLSVVHALVEMHGGTISAFSDGVEHGSTFVIRLPLADGVAETPSIAVAWPSSRTAKRVVVVEDNPDGAEMLSLLLQQAGYEVFTAADGRRGMEVIDEVEPDVALVDIGLPVMNGFELARCVRAHPRHRRLYLLALTGYGQASDRAAALDAGFDEHLVKPIDAEDLHRVLQQSRAGSQIYTVEATDSSSATARRVT